MEVISNRDLQQVVQDGSFEISSSEHLFKQSSTSLLAITFIVFFAYSVAKFIQNKNTAFGLDKTGEVPEIVTIIIRVIE